MTYTYKYGKSVCYILVIESILSVLKGTNLKKYLNDSINKQGYVLGGDLVLFLSIAAWSRFWFAIAVRSSGTNLM